MGLEINTLINILEKYLILWEQGLCVGILHPKEKEFLEKVYRVENIEEHHGQYFLDIHPNSLLVGWMLDDIAKTPEYENIRSSVEKIKKIWQEKGWTC